MRPAVDPTSDEDVVFVCKTCGYDEHNRGSWCALGCGRDYNEMLAVPRRAIRALEEQSLREAAREWWRGERDGDS